MSAAPLERAPDETLLAREPKLYHGRHRRPPIRASAAIVPARKGRDVRSAREVAKDGGLGRSIRERRQARGMALEELAKAAGFDPAQMVAAEAGELRIGGARRRRIARALDMPLSEVGLSALEAAASAAPRGQRSIFQTDWWLDAATDGNWTSVTAGDSADCYAWLPVCPMRKDGKRLLGMPPVTRTLGPVVTLRDAKEVSDRSQRYELLQRIIDRLPRFDIFHQVFDCAFDDSFAFAANGFTLYAQYTFTLDAQQPVDLLWSALKDKTRNRVRRGSERLALDVAIDTASFYDFYEENLRHRGMRCFEDVGVARRTIAAALERSAACIYGARNATGRLVAAIVLVWDGRKMYYLQSSRHPNDSDSTAVSFLLWKAIERAHEDGLVFDFDSFANRGGALFVSAFGGTLAQRPVVVAIRA